MDGWFQQQIGDIALSVGDGLCNLDGWVQHKIGDSAWSVGDGQCILYGWVQHQIGDSALSVGDDWAGWMAGFSKRSASVHGVSGTVCAG